MHIYAVYTQLVSEVLSLCQHLVATHAATCCTRNSLGWSLGDQSRITWGLKQDHLGTKAGSPWDQSNITWGPKYE